MSTSQQSLIEEFQTGKIGRRTFLRRAMALGLSLSSIEAIMAACTTGGSGGSGSSIKWSNWANTGEIQRFRDFTNNYNKTHNTNVQYTFVPSANANYFTKILTELNGGNAPDVFYAGDGDIGKLVTNKTIIELNASLNSSKAKEKASDFLPGLWGAAKTPSGKIYGVPVDCNPLLLWYNETVLQKAGITTMPAAVYEQGQWTRNAFQEMISKIKATGKYGYVLDSGSINYWAWCTANGGKVYDKNGYGNFIANQDPKSVDALNWLSNQIKQKTLVYAGSLPKGQGSDLALLSGQTGFIAVGRWDLPEFKSAGIKYDCVPFPTPSGKIGPAPVPLAYMVINAKTKLQDQAFDFLTTRFHRSRRHKPRASSQMGMILRMRATCLTLVTLAIASPRRKDLQLGCPMTLGLRSIPSGCKERTSIQHCPDLSLWPIRASRRRNRVFSSLSWM